MKVFHQKFNGHFLHIQFIGLHFELQEDSSVSRESIFILPNENLNGPDLSSMSLVRTYFPMGKTASHSYFPVRRSLASDSLYNLSNLSSMSLVFSQQENSAMGL